MFDLILFIDGSVDTHTRLGFGAYLAIIDMALPLVDIKPLVKVRRFENTSSTTLELQTLLWALDETLMLNTEKSMRVVIYSDSQNIVGLPLRRIGLEQSDYFARNGKRLNNYELYQNFFTVMDQCDCQIVKVSGHKPKHEKNDVDQRFSLVDKASRMAMREFTRQINNGSKGID